MERYLGVSLQGKIKHLDDTFFIYVPGLKNEAGLIYNEKTKEMEKSINNFDSALYFILSSSKIYQGKHE